MSTYANIRVRQEHGVGIVQIHRPQVRNALNGPTMFELVEALQAFDSDDAVGCLIITGSEKAFAAGADITQMAHADVIEILNSPFVSYWDGLRGLHKPLIAAVSGWCLGGGCELALLCDMIVASETAVFGQPEINLAIMPGAGGTQRLARTVGKALAMEMVLNDRRLSAQEALQYGLVNKVAPVDAYMDQALELAASIAARAPVAVRLAKEAVNSALETNLSEGLRLERRLFTLLFATEDQKEGMAAFLEKRQPTWQRR